MRQERKDNFSEDVGILTPLSEYLNSLLSRNNSFQSQQKSHRQSLFSPKSSYSDQKKSNSMIYSEKTSIPQSKNYYSIRSPNPFNLARDVLSNNEGERAPDFGKETFFKQDSFSSKIKEHANQEQNFSFGEESNNEEIQDEHDMLRSNVLNESFGDKNNNFEDYNQEGMQLNESFGKNTEAHRTFSPCEENQVYSMFIVDREEVNQLSNFIRQKFQNTNQQKMLKFEVDNVRESKIRSFLEKYIQKTPFDLRIFFQRNSDQEIHLKYQILDKIAESTFSFIYKCRDVQTKQIHCAKIIKEKKLYFDQSIYETYILQFIKKKAEPQKTPILDIISCFYMDQKLHIITELLGPSIYQAFIRPKIQASLSAIQTITRDLLFGLKFLRHYGIIHCDLKPENILLKKSESNFIKIIDFGSAIFALDNNIHCEMQTLPYRAPEIALGADFDYAIDMWSLGCILYELVTFNVLFNYSDERKNMIKAMALNKTIDFGVFQNVRNTNLLKGGMMSLQKQQMVPEENEIILVPNFSYSFENDLIMKCKEPLLVDLIKKCLSWDPRQRLTPGDALNHKFFMKRF